MLVVLTAPAVSDPGTGKESPHLNYVNEKRRVTICNGSVDTESPDQCAADFCNMLSRTRCIRHQAISHE